MRIVAAVAGAALVLPVAALAQEDNDLCHTDPTNPECIQGADDGVDDGTDDGDDGTDDGVDGADDGIDGTDDGAVDGADGGDDDGILGADDAFDGEVPSSEALAVTGTEIGPALGIVAGLLALGGLLLFGAHRRRAREG